ncbi:hypothetical protein FRC15_011258 [Serendipita sp. 397]|nr:hypothetical protein FRC15_011258 [Serendipita sp. 397]
MVLPSFAVLIHIASFAIIGLSNIATSKSLSGINKSLLYDGNLNARLTPFLYKHLPASTYRIERYYGRSEKEQQELSPCYQYSTEFCQKTTGSELEAIRVSFDDVADGSPESWILCQCNGGHSLLSGSTLVQEGESHSLERSVGSRWDYLLSHFSRVPPSLRRHIQAVITVPLVQLHPPVEGLASSQSPVSTSPRQSRAPHGMMSGGVVVLFGEPTFGTWIHEAAHALSLSLFVFSSSPLWVDSVKKDSCVTDLYSLKNLEEAFAQAVILKTYFQYRGNDINAEHAFHDELIGDYACMQFQLAALDCLPAFQGDRNHTPDTCEYYQVPAYPKVAQDFEHSDNSSWWELWLMTSLLLLLLVLAR